MSVKNDLHEGFDHSEEVRIGSPRAFGFVFAVVFTVISLWPLLEAAPVRFWAAGIACVFAACAIVKPSLLQPLNQMWFWFGIALHKIINPIVMGFLFFITVTPTGLIFRLIGKDPLNRKPDPNCETYWIERDPDDFVPESMRNQF